MCTALNQTLHRYDCPFELPKRQEEGGQSQFYEFMLSLYREMYQKPEEYLVFPQPYEEYMKKLKEQEAGKKKEKEHVTNSRESTLRNTFQQAIQFYALYLYRVGLKSKGIDGQTGALLLRKEDYADVIGQMERIHESQYNDARYEVLAKCGIGVEEDGDTIFIVHRDYPQMMEGIAYLCKAPDSKYKWMNFLRLDFKNAYSPIPTVDDICKTLPAESVEVVKKLETDLAGRKVKTKIRPLRGIVSDFKWKVEYSCKGKNICGFYADKEFLCFVFILIILLTLRRLRRLYIRRTANCFSGSRSSSPKGYANVPITEGSILAASRGGSADCPIGQRS